jgi:hypothetical protein
MVRHYRPRENVVEWLEAGEQKSPDGRTESELIGERSA